jgi:hypothetical protein
METPRKDPPIGLSLAMVAALLAIGILCTGLHVAGLSAASVEGQASASSTAAGSSVLGVVDGDRFSLKTGSFWQGATGDATWWWQIRFPQPQPVGCILQINGNHPSILSKAPRRYVWQCSEDGQTWRNLPETEINRERRLFRVHRLQKPHRAVSLRIMIHESVGEAPTLREIEIYPEPSATVNFPDWLIAVSTTTENSRLPGETGSFVDLARKCRGWENVLAQQVWMGDFDEAFVSVEPPPLCAFLSGNFLEWCQQAREPWRGVGEVFANRNLPIWASCGGAQALAILQETGVDKPWDCPRCRDPQRPKSPVYSHIGYTGEAECGDYSKNVAERGKFNMRLIARDPAFQGLPPVFEAMESHIGQIAYLPKGWVRVVTKGPGALTENQCLRVADRYIYAAQFHVEMKGTPENSRRIMANFLRLAKAWGGYNPRGKAVPLPDPIAAPPD